MKGVLLFAMLVAMTSSSIVVYRVLYITQKFNMMLQHSLEDHLQEIDPLMIDGKEIKLFRVLPFLKLVMNQVEIDGLSDMKSYGVVRLLKSEKLKTLQVTLEAPRIFFSAKSVLILHKQSLRRTLFGHADNVRFYLEVDYDSDKDQVSLSSFKVKNMEMVRLHYDGAPIIVDFVENSLLSIISSYMSSVVRVSIEKSFTPTLSKIFASNQVLKEIMRSV